MAPRTRLLGRSSPLSAAASALLAACAASVATADVPNGSCATAAIIDGNGVFSVPSGQSAPTNTTVTDCGDGQFACWYRFTAPSSGTIVVSGLPSNYGEIAVVAIKQSCQQESFLACSISKGDFAAITSASVSGGQTYRVVFAMLTSELTPNDIINVEFSFLPDVCENAPEAATCCVAGPWLGCSTVECCSQICAVDPLCCSEGWDLNCTQQVRKVCGICLAPDCDQNGVDDALEYGANPKLALLPYLNSDSIGNPEAYCPTGTLQASSTLIFTGLSGLEESRTLEVPYGKGLALGGLVATGATVGVYPGDSTPPLTLTGGGLRADRSEFNTRLTLLGLSLDTPVANVGGSGTGNALPILTLASCSATIGEIQADVGIFNVGDTFDYVGTTVFADEVFVGPLGALRVRENSSCEAANSIVVEGLLQVDFGATFSSIDPMIEGSLPSSWLRGAGTLVGFVGWRGCLKPSGPLEIQGQLSLLPFDGAEQARFLWKIRDVAQPSLTVTGPAILSGTLQIDASDASIGDEAMILRAGNLIGDFKNIQTVGLPPQFAMLVQRVQGGFFEELRASVVPIGQLLGFGDSTSYPLTLIPQDAVSADFDGDGVEDLAISLSGGETQNGAIVVFRGTGSGLEQVLQLNPGVDPRGIDAGDINLDGKIDLVVALAGDDAIRELRNTSTAGISFNALAPFPVGDKPVDVSLGNFIADGTELAGSKLDAFVAVELSQEFTFVKNSGGTLGDGGSSSIPSPGGLPTSTGGGDTDNDRVDDGVGGSTGGGTVIPGGTSGSAFTPIFIPTPHPVTSIEVFDITGDGIDDVVASLDATTPRPTPPGTPEVFDTVAIINATFASNGAAYLLNLYDFGREGRSLSKGDFDLDGDEDLAFASVPAAGGAASLRVVRNDMGPGGALLTELAPPAIAGEVTVVETISIDGNGDDVVVAGPTNLASDSQVTLQRFAEPAIYGDLTGDGIINALDLKVLLSQWGNPGSGDLNLDGQVLGADLAILLYLWTFPPAK